MKELRYDESCDVLRIDRASRADSWACEEVEGVTVFRNRHTDEIVGLLVYDFLRG